MLKPSIAPSCATFACILIDALISLSTSTGSVWLSFSRSGNSTSISPVSVRTTILSGNVPAIRRVYLIAMLRDALLLANSPENQLSITWGDFNKRLPQTRRLRPSKRTHHDILGKRQIVPQRRNFDRDCMLTVQQHKRSHLKPNWKRVVFICEDQGSYPRMHHLIHPIRHTTAIASRDNKATCRPALPARRRPFAAVAGIPRLLRRDLGTAPKCKG